MSVLEDYLLHCNGNEKKPLIIVCPGGGYTHHSPREAVPVAKKFNSLGFHAVVLYYSLYPKMFPESLLDLSKAIKYYRDNSEKLGIISNQIIVCGFSAGGHLCASSGVFWNEKFLTSKLNCKADDIKPNMLCLCYPVITAGEYAHKGSFVNLCGGSEDSYNIEKYQNVSLEKHVNANVPPVFLWHTVQDDFVPAENSMLFANELKQKSIPFELHLFSKGPHGIALATEETSREGGIDIVPECQIWPELFAAFFETYFNVKLQKEL